MSMLDYAVNIRQLLQEIVKKSLENAVPIAEGIAKLFHPFAEVVIHDLETDRIQAIYNPISRREVGDDSYLDLIDFDQSKLVIGPYEKINWDGRKLKSISAVIRNGKNIAEGFLCINVDISHFDAMQTVFAQFLNNNTPMTIDEQKLFKDDLYEQINAFVQNYCLEHQVAINALSREDKRTIICLLEAKGAFNGRNAPTYISRILGVSRATVYNYLKIKEASS